VAASLEIWKVLCVSTAHLTEAERLDLDEVATYPHREGYGAVWWVGLEGPGEIPADVSDWSEGAQAVVKIARENGCSYVAFDADADAIAGVPTYE
jgi:hypothetical protein